MKSISLSLLFVSSAFASPDNLFMLGFDPFSVHTKLEVENRDIFDVRKFSGFQFSYEHLKLDSVYASLSYSFNAGTRGFEEDYEVLSVPKSVKKTRRNNIEGAIGFNTPYSGGFISTFVGLGEDTLEIGDHCRRGLHKRMDYFFIGAKPRYTFTQYFDGGLNIKAFKSYNQHMKLMDPFTDIMIDTPIDSSVSGMEIGIPLIFKSGVDSRCIFQTEPYVRNNSFKNTQMVYGTRFSIGYKL